MNSPVTGVTRTRKTIENGCRYQKYLPVSRTKRRPTQLKCSRISKPSYEDTQGRGKARKPNTGIRAFHGRHDLLKTSKQLKQTMPPLNNHFSNDHKERLTKELGNNLAYKFSQVHEGVCAITKRSKYIVVKGYNSQGTAEIEQISTQFMRTVEEKTPDSYIAGPNLGEQIVAFDSDFKKEDDPRLCTTMVTKNNEPKHIIIMPNLDAINLQNILQNPSLRSSFKAKIGAHITEISRIGFKDLIIGNGDRCIQLHPESESTTYLRDLVAINRGNLMFQTQGEHVLPGTAIAIDNNNTLTDYTKEGNALDELRQTELTAFKHYLSISGLNAVISHLKIALKVELDISEIHGRPSSSVKPKWAHVPELLDGLIDLSDEEQHALIGLSDDQQANILIDKLDKTLEGLIREGFKQGLRQVKDNKRKIDDLLKKEGRTPSYTNEAKNFIEVLKAKLSVLYQSDLYKDSR